MTATAYAAPTPVVFYIHDDLSDDVRRVHGADSLALQLTQELFTLVRRRPERVVVLHLEEQIARLIAGTVSSPFAVTIGIGAAGERVARQVHQRTGWFPHIRRVEVSREEDNAGGYTLVSTTDEPLLRQVHGLEACPSVAVVDDTVFSGLTMRTVLQALPATVLARTQAFCLRGVAESLPGVRALCPLAIGFAAPGRLLDEVSFINAAGLVRRRLVPRPAPPSSSKLIHPAVPESGT